MNPSRGGIGVPIPVLMRQFSCLPGPRACLIKIALIRVRVLNASAAFCRSFSSLCAYSLSHIAYLPKILSVIF